MKKIEELLFRTIDKQIIGVDYYNNDGSFWLIFTEQKKWVIEYTDSQMLWYNFRFFDDIFSWFGLTDEKDNYITKWFELRFLNINQVEDTIQNGVKDTEGAETVFTVIVEDTIQNGVKDTSVLHSRPKSSVEDTIKNGVKNTIRTIHRSWRYVEDTIQNGVKNTYSIEMKDEYLVEDTIQNGVKNTIERMYTLLEEVEDTIQNGVKQTKKSNSPKFFSIDNTIQNGSIACIHGRNNKRKQLVENTIKDGTKID